MLVEIPLQKIVAQKVRLYVNNQECLLYIYEKGDTNPRLYIDLYKDSMPICLGAICLNSVPIIQRVQSLFQGNFVFINPKSLVEPQYQKLNPAFTLQANTNHTFHADDDFIFLYYTEDEDIMLLQENAF